MKSHQGVGSSVESDAKVVAFCSGCHRLPDATSFPQDAWHDEVKRGFDFYYQSNRRDLYPPPVQVVVDYFRSRAPKLLQVGVVADIESAASIQFRPSEFSVPNSKKPVAISFVGNWPHPDRKASDLILSDMLNGQVYSGELIDGALTLRSLVDLQNPAGISRCDLNGNGAMDLIVADLGSFNPADHNRGRVVWIPDVDLEAENQAAIDLATSLGRVADVQPADIDADGDFDLIVAEFGWHATGRILLLRNDGDRQQPKYSTHVIDRRPGAIHVPVVDLNRDGKPDFIALISQEFECIDVFLNQGEGLFEKNPIYPSADPAYGSSGIQVVDLDGDGDEDVLYTNGDMFDSFIVKPYHGVQWLENKGDLQFVTRRLIDLPGAYRALAADLDGDGDRDIVATAFVPSQSRETELGAKLISLVWFEQTSAGQFQRHTIEVGNCVHAAMDLADFDGDGDIDIAVGAFREEGSKNQSAITLWLNEPASPRAAVRPAKVFR